MKICFLLNADPEKDIGGTPTVVRHIKKYFNADVLFSPFPGGIVPQLFSFVNAIKLLFSDCDVVNIHDTQGYFYMLLPKFMRKKTIYTCHGLWEIYYSVAPPKNNFEKIKAKIAARMQRRILKRSDYVITVSNFVKKQILLRSLAEESKITVIHNGVDTKKFKPLKKSIKKTAYIWVGNNPTVKGLHEAIEFSKKYNKKLIVVGVNGKGTSLIKYAGIVEPEKMCEYYNEASLLLFFSKFEGHPLVPLEAMACGLGVIATKESNIEIVPLQKDGMYKINGANALKIIKKYDWKNRADKYRDVFSKLLR